LNQKSSPGILHAAAKVVHKILVSSDLGVNSSYSRMAGLNIEDQPGGRSKDFNQETKRTQYPRIQSHPRMLRSQFEIKVLSYAFPDSTTAVRLLSFRSSEKETM